MIEQTNIDEFAVLPNDTNNDYKNQFLEFLRKNKPSTEEQQLKEIKVKKRKKELIQVFRYIMKIALLNDTHFNVRNDSSLEIIN